MANLLEGAAGDTSVMQQQNPPCCITSSITLTPGVLLAHSTQQVSRPPQRTTGMGVCVRCSQKAAAPLALRLSQMRTSAQRFSGSHCCQDTGRWALKRRANKPKQHKGGAPSKGGDAQFIARQEAPRAKPTELLTSFCNLNPALIHPQYTRVKGT